MSNFFYYPTFISSYFRFIVFTLYILHVAFFSRFHIGYFLNLPNLDVCIHLRFDIRFQNSRFQTIAFAATHASYPLQTLPNRGKTGGEDYWMDLRVLDYKANGTLNGGPPTAVDHCKSIVF